MDQDAALIRLAVLGNPVKHSHSPWIHSRFASEAGLDVDYSAIEVDADHLSRVLLKLADEGARGCNLTLPHKQEAFKLANRAGDSARIPGSANTLVFESPSRWRAENTDGPGLVQDVLHNHSISLAERSVCVLGAGGAAAGILYDLLLQRPANLTLLNRNPERAKALAQRLEAHGRIQAGGLNATAVPGGFDLLIHATAAGHRGTGPVLSDDLFATDAVCYDLNYGAAHEELSLWCSERGITCHDGLGMLVEQAAASFEIWTGYRPQSLPVIEALRDRVG